MVKGKENRIKELINIYIEWDSKDTKYNSFISCMARDEKRFIKKQFKKEIHENIETYL